MIQQPDSREMGGVADVVPEEEAAVQEAQRVRYGRTSTTRNARTICRRYC